MESSLKSECVGAYLSLYDDPKSIIRKQIKGSKTKLVERTKLPHPVWCKIAIRTVKHYLVIFRNWGTLPKVVLCSLTKHGTHSSETNSRV